MNARTCRLFVFLLSLSAFAFASPSSRAQEGPYDRYPVIRTTGYDSAYDPTLKGKSFVEKYFVVQGRKNPFLRYGASKFWGYHNAFTGDLGDPLTRDRVIADRRDLVVDVATLGISVMARGISTMRGPAARDWPRPRRARFLSFELNEDRVLLSQPGASPLYVPSYGGGVGVAMAPSDEAMMALTAAVRRAGYPQVHQDAILTALHGLRHGGVIASASAIVLKDFARYDEEHGRGRNIDTVWTDYMIRWSERNGIRPVVLEEDGITDDWRVFASKFSYNGQPAIPVEDWAFTKDACNGGEVGEHGPHTHGRQYRYLAEIVGVPRLKSFLESTGNMTAQSPIILFPGDIELDWYRTGHGALLDNTHAYKAGSVSTFDRFSPEFYWMPEHCKEQQKAYRLRFGSSDSVVTNTEF